MLGCKKNEFRRDEFEDPTGKAFVKIGYFVADSVARSVQIYINNALVSNTLSSHTPFPGGGYNTGGASDNGYLAVDASKGTAEFRFVTPVVGSTIIASEVFKVSAPVTANKQQVVFICDTTTKATAFTVDVTTDRPDSGYAKFNFANCIPNSGPIDFYYRDSLIASNVAYKGQAGFVTLPLRVSPAVKIYPSGVDTVGKLIATYPFTSIGNQKIYTALGRGYLGKADAQRIPKVSLVIVK
jgi:hypothetical protein